MRMEPRIGRLLMEHALSHAQIFATLAQNAGLLSVIVIVYTQLGHVALRHPELRRIALGGLLGLTAVASMSVPVPISPGVFIDGRSILMVLAGPFAGPLGTLIAASLAASYRAWIGGAGAAAGVVGILLPAAGGLVFSLWVSRKGRGLGYPDLVALGVIAVVSIHMSLVMMPSLAVVLGIVRTVSVPLSIVTFAGVPLLGWLLLQEQRRVELEERLKRSEQRHRLLADHSTDMISQFNLDLERHYVSPACKRLFGYEPSELIGARTPDHMHPEDVELVRSTTRLLSEVEFASVQYRFRHKAGHWVWTEASLARTVDPVTGEIEIVSVARDITARKTTEEALQAANQAKSQFLANMSHELRTPLNAVIGFAEMMKQEVLGPIGGPKYRDYASHIEESGRHLLRLINDVLDLSKVEAGKMDIAEDDFVVGDLIRSSVETLLPRAEKSGVALQVITTAAVDGCYGDVHRLRQALLNLLSNAIKFTPGGGRVVVAADVSVDGQLVISVKDTGRGIAAADMEKLFQPFSQVGNLLSRRTEGTGLGLALTRRFVDLHGGRVWLESERGVGTTAYLTLPAWRVARGGNPAARAAS